MTRRLRILVVDEGNTMNCDLFREVPEHEIERLDCGSEAGADGMFRSRWAKITESIRGKRYDLAVVTDRKHCFWKPGSGAVAGFFRWGKAHLTEPRRLAHLQIPRQLSRAGIPWALIERNDQCLIREGNHLLFHLATRVFVRELLQNRYEIFQSYREGGDRMRLWPKVLRGGPRVPLALDKILPISLGLRPGLKLPEMNEGEKTHDVFWSGGTAFRTPRISAVEELRESAHRLGWKFVIREALSEQTYLKECSRAWLSLSPSGNGWDCFRHYEAAAAGSVPVINYPWIERYAPLQDARHCFLYPVERGALTTVVQRALGDKEALRRMGRDAVAHVNRHHTYEALRKYVIHETLQAAAGPGDRIVS
jgi:hypothetical protein